MFVHVVQLCKSSGIESMTAANREHDCSFFEGENKEIREMECL